MRLNKFVSESYFPPWAWKCWRLKEKRASQVGLPAKRNWRQKRHRQVWSLGREDPLEDGMANHSSISCQENPHRKRSLMCLQSTGSQRVGHDWSNLAHKEKRKKKYMSCRESVYVGLRELAPYFFPVVPLMSCPAQADSPIQQIFWSQGPHGKPQNPQEGGSSWTSCGLLSVLLKQFHFQALGGTSWESATNTWVHLDTCWIFYDGSREFLFLDICIFNQLPPGDSNLPLSFRMNA